MTPKDAVLRRVGRNLVNYQRWETALRALIPTLNLSLTPTTAEQVAATNARAVKRTPLGTLAHSFHTALFTSADNEPASAESSEVRFSFAFRLESDPEFTRQYRAELMSIVKERNALVHRELAGVNFEVEDQCDRLSTKLDEQNVRVCHQLSFLKEILAMRTSAAEEFIAFVNSKEFLEQFSHEAGDA